jgi:RNA polymerase-interacting CarD/CdnL/TRCF family regulator
VTFYSTGDRVSQPQYGHGTVTAVNQYHTVIDFDEHGSRTFVTLRVQLEQSATTAPVKKTRRAAKRKN